MATVKIGSARIDERGKATGGKSGDQSGNEVSQQNWYKHSKGWVVIRPKDPEVGKHIAWCMTKACANNKIGYDQNQRDTLYVAAKPCNFDVTKVTTPVETDCSALVRVCVLYAFKQMGITASLGSFSTGTQVSHLRATKQFDILTASKYVNQASYLRTGDILVTATKGHTVVVLNDGSKAEYPSVKRSLGDRVLSKGSDGEDVRELQTLLAALGHDPEGIDGEYGSLTASAVKDAQKALGIAATGVADLATIAAIKDAHGKLTDPEEEDVEPESGYKVTATQLNVRKGPGTDFSVVSTVKNGDLLSLVVTEGWVPVLVGGEVCWVSAQYVNAINLKGVMAV